jgi:translation initiation factor 2B subunit (eIF-2B alpha/beta/delta family)
MGVVDKTVKEIKELKIQGAENVARAAIVVWSEAKDKKKASEKLSKARQTEPMLRNILKYLENLEMRKIF